MHSHSPQGTILHPDSYLTRKRFTVSARDFRLDLGRETRIMGILNLTPDSFSGDGILTKNKYDTRRNILSAQRLIGFGADIIDIGGESTRPGSQPIRIEEEIRRIIPTIRLLAKKIKIPISVDTYKERVAREALDAGASIINDIMGVKASQEFLRMVKRYNAAIVLMHIRGTPQTMQKNIRYKDVVTDIISHLQKSIEKCLEVGIKSDKIIIDPGIGFGKTTEHNLEILQRLSEFKVLDKPLLIGTSRKSFIGNVLGKDVSQRLMGTIATVSVSILKGAHIVRVHDVKEITDAVKMCDAIFPNEQHKLKVNSHV